MDSNVKIEQAKEAILKGKNVYLFGKAGTGKSTLIKEMVNELEKLNLGVVVLAPTGVAAINCGGQTIHSFFGFKPMPCPYSTKGNKLRDILRKVDVLIIDEISMVRADLLDAVFDTMKRFCPAVKPWGGKQFIAVGDPLQLPPVVREDDDTILKTRYKNGSYFFFDSRAYKSDEDKVIISLDHVFRQSDEKFKNILNAIRDNELTETDLNELNKRSVTTDPSLKSKLSAMSDYISLCPYNEQADKLNQMFLSKLTTDSKTYVARIQGDFKLTDTIIPEQLELRIGARVMTCTNSSDGDYFNGSLGTVVSFNDKEVRVRLDNGDVVSVSRITVSSYKYELDPTGDLEQKEVGSFTQMPLKLAYGITIHKSQGLTFDNQLIILHKGVFAPSQLYVALSRVRSLDGLFLSCDVKPSMVYNDSRIVKYMMDIDRSQTNGFEDVLDML